LGDVTVIQLTGPWGKLNIFNIYNDCNHNKTITALSKFQHEQTDLLEKVTTGSAHTIWLGDFNRHHPHWDNHDNTRLFTKDTIKAAETLIEATAEAGLKLALPRGIPTHVHNVTKMWTRLNQVFISEHSTDLITACNTEPSKRGINSDHLPILTKLDLATTITKESATHNFREVDWEEFNKELGKNLVVIESAVTIYTQYQLNESCNKLMTAIWTTISKVVLVTCINAKSKHWWTKELTKLRQ
jgi:Endonuclease-reverse transcriptase